MLPLRGAVEAQLRDKLLLKSRRTLGLKLSANISFSNEELAKIFYN